jgi:hypothetical protein
MVSFGALTPRHRRDGRPSPFIIDVFARRIVGWRVSTSMTTSFVLDALNQAICQRYPAEGGGFALAHRACTDGATMGNSRTHGDAVAHSTTQTAAAVRRLTYPSATPSAWPTQASAPRWAAWVTVMTVSMVLRLDGLTHATIDCVSLR